MDGLDARTVDVDGTRIRCFVGGDGPPVVLLHGGGLDSATLSWRETVPALLDSHTVYVPDLPGYGKSDDPPSGESVSIGYYVGVLARLFDEWALSEATLVGISMGGGVALGYALDYPERVSRVVAVDSYGLGGTIPGGKASTAMTRVPYLFEALWWVLRRSRYAAKLTVSSIVDRRNVTAGFVDEVFAALRARNTDAWQRFQRAEVGFDGLLTNYVERLPELPIPTLLVHGETDPLVPVEWAVRAATLIPDAEVRILADCGHWPPRERPKRFNELLLGFLDENRD
ncbi:alpha/beta hydrolase [Haloprofundus marisrubri]|uniref:Alpha/beta hydrolase n=1 Tax=Haloprofundus marisrubri TaxID=1514971 RepID=A0A0W1RCW4_9EURY|nr:alpha/beta hydrolase [Haloprofundus marisrubri]KTG11278.1 alpha/beta hydrolase [Haloprofundus marisrubri]